MNQKQFDNLVQFIDASDIGGTQHPSDVTDFLRLAADSFSQKLFSVLLGGFKKRNIPRR